MKALLYLSVLAGLSRAAYVKNLNPTVDAMLKIAHQQLDYLSLPDINKSVNVSTPRVMGISLGIKMARFTASGGKFGRLSTLYRYGAAAMEINDDGTAVISAKLGLGELQVRYEEYEFGVLLANVKGNAAFSCNNVSISVQVYVDKRQKACNAAVQKVTFDTVLGNCKVELKGIPLSKLFGFGTEQIIGLFESHVKKVISDRLVEFFHNTVQNSKEILCMMLNKEDDDDDD